MSYLGVIPKQHLLQFLVTQIMHLIQVLETLLFKGLTPGMEFFRLNIGVPWEITPANEVENKFENNKKKKFAWQFQGGFNVLPL